MKPNHNSAEALSSLYEAFGLPESGTMPCFAGAADGESPCREALPNRRRSFINILMQLLSLHEFARKDPVVSQSLEKAITDLALKLVCNLPPKSHAVRFKRDLISLLSSKFEQWQSENANAGISKSKRASNQDTRHSSQESGDQTDKDDVLSTSRQEKRQRPELAREKPRDERELFQTPVRGRRLTSGGKGRGGESSKSPPRPSDSDDEFIISPESIASPDPDELFTPLSAASTPCSLASTMEFESRRYPFRNSHRKRQDVSPTRRADLAGVDSLERDMRRKLNLVDLVSDRESDSDEEGGFDEEGEEGESDDEISSDIQRLDAKSDEETTARSLFQPMRFVPKRKEHIRKILEQMAKRAKRAKDGRNHGWIYGFTDASAPGHIKIGYTKDSVEKRKQKWIRTCGHEELNLEFEAEMPCAVERMEQLVHLTLHMEREDAWCPFKECKKKHKEWFEISRKEAESVVKMWQRFSKLMPYHESGYLDDIWSAIVATALRDGPYSSSSKEWLEKELLAIISEQEG
ncbi:hypothetical protein NW752_006175 [Fusarium irregulare]|uniref:Bacteriophage T5 Orf172 DNA-binding domain-containing protein n=1 Tax=Fusarium irregulare TaxID=2494466 RepID=A0A9W8UAA5_9HYPO|nr:hypothetical protein NW766_006716 [Fusarium irregulare]KAJ4017094.1 hypothetical protein NW752_006175 [Fusarium irregulare]